MGSYCSDRPAASHSDSLEPADTMRQLAGIENDDSKLISRSARHGAWPLYLARAFRESVRSHPAPGEQSHTVQICKQ